MTRGLFQHLLITLRLNFRSGQAIVYGYVVPVLFLFGFAAVFHSSSPPLLHEMGQLVTITILGGACFGMPTAMVSERERGVWRRYRMLPASTAALIVSAMVARYVIILPAAAIQFALARWVYGTPLPAHPLAMLAAFSFAAFAFLGMGLIIAMVAETVPAVQALGQAIFLPMILIGGIGVPLRALPEWARHVADYLPGRYAVEALDMAISPGGTGVAGFALAALAVIGAAACVTGAQFFRWDAAQRVSARAKAWILLSLAAWVAVGLVSERKARQPWQDVSAADVSKISFENLPKDDGLVAPIAPDLDELSDDSKERVAEIRQKLDAWAPGLVADPVQRVRNLLCVASVPDILEDSDEGAIGYVVIDRIQSTIPAEDLKKILPWIILHPDDGTVLTSVTELGIPGEVTLESVRDRSVIYARKLLLRVLKRPPD